MASDDRQYLCIDLKSFYASVECVERGLDPMTTRLVVADPERSDKTICLAVSPAMKALGVRNRCRVFEIPPDIDYIMATPRMALYVERSADIYGVYLTYLAPEDIHVYSIDEVFMDVTDYLSLYGCTARELGERIRADVLARTGIPASCGIGPNLYLAKIALDITAKHSPNFFGELDEESYKATLWNHRPLTDFWRIGEGIQRRLALMGIHTMGELAMAPEEPLYKEFGIDAEILIDHAWGIEPVRMEHIKAYRSESHSLSSGQVLMRDYNYADALTVAKEMADGVALDLVRQGKLAASISIWVGYAMTAEMRAAAREEGGMRAWYRSIPSSGGTKRFPSPTNSREAIYRAVVELFEADVDRDTPIRRMTVNAGGVVDEGASGIQLDLFADGERLDSEHRRQEAVAAVKARFGNNAVLKGIDLLPEATGRERNRQIGGHKSGV
ncbi:MAG: Y-family DNA polymerase [Coriobacteriaceae bacterium]|nr:Y-family DNA polymerase [Coriobacteriaceae bacterium]